MNKYNALAAAGVLAAAAFFAVQASADDATADSASPADTASPAGENENSAFANMVATPNHLARRASVHATAHGAYGYKYKPGTLSRVSAKTSG